MNEAPKIIGNRSKKFPVRQVNKINSQMTIHHTIDVSVSGSNHRSSLAITSGRESLMTLPKFVDQSKPSFNQMLRAMHNRDLEAGTSQEAK
jgi:hypothetical protein